MGTSSARIYTMMHTMNPFMFEDTLCNINSIMFYLHYEEGTLQQKNKLIKHMWRSGVKSKLEH